MPVLQHMRFPGAMLLLLGLLLAGCEPRLVVTDLERPALEADTLRQLHATAAENMAEVLALKGLLADAASPEGFLTADPYHPVTPLGDSECEGSEPCRYQRQRWLRGGQSRFLARPDVAAWWQSRRLAPETAEVCGVRFQDEARQHYRLRSFPSAAALAAEPGWHLSHYQACGSCSTLQDLAVYAERDLTAMASTCARHRGVEGKKRCMQDIGFTEACAETWAYNARQTVRQCALTCVATMLSGTNNNVGDGAELNACLLCDEMLAGPGFQYAAGRIRRNSGIVSEIERPGEQFYPVAHDYFDTP